MDAFSFGPDKPPPPSATSRLTSKKTRSAKQTPTAVLSSPDFNAQKSAGPSKVDFSEITDEETKTDEINPPSVEIDLDDRDAETENFLNLNFDNFTQLSKNSAHKKFEEGLVNDNEIRNNVRQVVYIDQNVPKFGVLFWIEVFQIVWMTTTTITGFLVFTNSVVINNYIFLIVGSLITLVSCSLQVFFFFIQIQKYPNLSKETYYNDIGTTVVVTFVLEIFAWLSLGIWIRDFGICCDQSGSQPNPFDPNNFNRFYLSYLLLMILPLVAMIMVYPRSIAAHMNPTKVYNITKKE